MKNHRSAVSYEGEIHRHGSVELENFNHLHDVPASDVILFEKTICERPTPSSRSSSSTLPEITIDMASSTMEEAKLPGGYLVTPRVPQGLAAAVEGLTREVIRHSPEDIYVFAAHHFEKLLELREQCGIVREKSLNRDGRMDTLREMNRALREREVDRENVKTARNTIDQVGWSLNQTAKVLKRHRSIFGEEGRRITTDEVFQMATHKGNRSRSPKSTTKKIEYRGKRSAKEKTSAQKSDDIWKASTSRAEHSWPKEDSIDDDNGDKTKTGPKIITRISNLPSGSNVMLAKDIKTELRKNRISSRERRNVRARHESKDTAERSDGKVVRSSGKNCSTKKSLDRQKRIDTDVEEKHSRKYYESTISSSSSKEFQHAGKSHSRDGSISNKENAKTRTSSMDRVRDYVIERFATTRSLEELQTLDYIERVQKIIDETGPIIKDKVEQLKSGMIGGSDGNSAVPDARRVRERRFDDSPRDKNGGLSKRRYSPDISPSEISTNDALITRLAETRNLMENVSSGLTKSSRRSRSARSSRRSDNFNINDDTSEDSRVNTIAFVNRDNGLETKLSRTRDLLKDISSTLSKPMRRSCSATSLNKRCETMEDVGGNKDPLKKRLDETRNLLKGISASFGKFADETSNNRMTIDPDESFGPGEENLSKTSLPAVKSVSMKNSSSSVSRSDSANLVLPAISPEVTKSSKIKEDLILPILSPPSTASTNGDSGKALDINDDVPLKDFGIPETPVQDYTPEVPIDNVSRDSLNVTPDFDSIPQRPDSLEPVEIIDDPETNEPEVSDLEIISKPADGVRKVDSDDLPTIISDKDNAETTAEVDQLGARTLEVNEDHIANARLDASRTETINSDDLQAETTIPDDTHPKTSSVASLEARLREIQKAEMDIEEILGSQTKSDSQKSENSDALNKQRELEDVETRVTTVSCMDNPDGDKVSEEHGETSVDMIEMPANSGRNVEEKTRVEEDGRKPGEDDLIGEDDKMGLGDNDDDKLQIISPEPVNYTYVLTEGSPYDIPDTVTTVIIPERIIDSPLSDRLHVELEDGVGAKLSLLSDHSKEEKSIRNNVDKSIGFAEEPMKDSNEIDTISSLDSEAKLFLASDLETDEKSIEHIVEKSIDEDLVEPDVVIEALKDSNLIDAIPSDKIEQDLETIADRSMNNLPQSSDKDNSSNMLDPFGELVKPESITEIATDIDFIRELENIPEIQMSHQDLGPINEEVIEELEEFEEKRGVKKTMDDDARTEGDEEESGKEIEIFKGDGENGEKKTYLGIDESRIIESDLSPEGTRPSVCSESSNETKESSVADEALESTKRERSMDEEVSSDTRTAESSNEVKETTLTDGLSLSLDPSRPYVPELNLDSLQDITVSSFKMTEEDNDNQEPGESENTNSITETLTSDENNRVNDSREFMEEAVVEYLPSSSSRSKSNEIDDETEKREEEVVEETIVERRVEVKEDICEKKSTYVTGPGGQEINVDDNAVEPSRIEEGREEQKGNIAIAERKEEDTTKKGMKKVSSNETTTAESVEMEKMEQDGRKTSISEEEMVKMDSQIEEGRVERNKESLNEAKAVESVEMEKMEEEEEKTARSEEEIVKTEVSKQIENTNIVEMEGEKKNQESGENTIDEKPAAASAEVKLELDIVKSSEEKKNGGESSEDTLEKESASAEEEVELDVAKNSQDESRSSEKNVCTKLEISELPKKEEMVHDLDTGRLSSERMLKNSESTDTSSVVHDEVGKPNEEMQVEEEESEDALEENDIDEETPLAVSRSASQCTTRRVSSGNLAKLRDHPTLERIDKIDDQDEKSEHDSGSSKVKFTDTTLEVEGRQTNPNDRNDDDETAKDSKEYHIYVPEVDASGDYSTTESSTFDSAVTKIQAGVRGFLTRRRLQRGQGNRSSTLSSIPSIQDSIAIEPYHAEDQDLSSDKTGMASSKVSKDNEFVDAATRIQSNYRGYKARKRLRRENAVQRTTISLEKSFGESGLQHTGEFHDCIPLPIHDITIEKKILDSGIEEKQINEVDYFTKEEKNLDENLSKSNETREIIFSHSTNDPIIRFNVGPNVSRLVDLVVLAKNEDALQTGYLNFITSVEDTETIVGPAEVGAKNFQADEPTSRESLREPLALSGPPVGLVIEEITSSGPENSVKIDEEHDRTMASVNSSILPPEVEEESLHPPRIAPDTPPALAESKEARQGAEQFNEQSRNDREDTGSSEMPNERYEGAGVPDQTMASTFNPAESVPLVIEPLVEDFILPTSLSSIQEQELLGPESCVDSMEHKAVESMADKIPSVEKDWPDLSEEIDDRIEEESTGSHANDGSSKLSFSMKVEDLLDLGSDGNSELTGKKPVSQGTLGPNDLVKSMGLSQESQLADERIGSPVTMIQIAPERTESLEHDDLSDDSKDEDTNNGEKDGRSSTASESKKK